jgi:hypothetical protein
MTGITVQLYTIPVIEPLMRPDAVKTFRLEIRRREVPWEKLECGWQKTGAGPG